MNHEEEVKCMAICEGESMIVSGSRSATSGIISIWNFETNAMIGEPMRGHAYSVERVSVDEKGKILYLDRGTILAFVGTLKPENR